MRDHSKRRNKGGDPKTNYQVKFFKEAPQHVASHTRAAEKNRADYKAKQQGKLTTADDMAAMLNVDAVAPARPGSR